MGIHVGEPLRHRRGVHGNRRPPRGPDRLGGPRRPDPPLGAPRRAPDGFAVRDLGSHRLAGLPEPEHIHQLLADGLPRDFPPLRNTIALLGNAMTVVIAEDSILLREGVVRLLGESGFEVVAQSDNAGRPAATRRHAQAGGRDRRHPDAADPHRRGARRCARDPRAATRAPACSCSPSTSSPATRSGCSRRAPRASATCSRTASPTWRSSPRPCAASARAARRSIPPSSASSSAAGARTTRSTR